MLDFDSPAAKQKNASVFPLAALSENGIGFVSSTPTANSHPGFEGKSEASIRSSGFVGYTPHWTCPSCTCGTASVRLDQRYYNSNTGSFWSPDPGGLATANPKDPTSWNRYAYAGDDPVNFNDPSGRARCSVVGTFTTFDPDNQETPISYAEIQCTSAAGSIFVDEWVTRTYQDGVQQAKALGKTVDQQEMSNFRDLLALSIARVQADLTKSDCAKDFKNAARASAKAGTAGFSDQGELRYVGQDGVITAQPGSPGVARYNRFTGSINLNSEVDWSFPSSTNALLNGSGWMVDLLAGQAAALGISSITGDQYMDLTILHELSHYNGAIGNPDTNPGVEKALWNDCIH